MKAESSVTGKRGEYMVIGKFLAKGLTIYTPVVDIEGIDCIIKNEKGRLMQVQIKTRNEDNNKETEFKIKDFKPNEDYFICCYFINTEELWVIPSFVFKSMSYLRKDGCRVLYMNWQNRKKLNSYKNDSGLKLLGYRPYSQRAK